MPKKVQWDITVYRNQRVLPLGFGPELEHAVLRFENTFTSVDEDGGASLAMRTDNNYLMNHSRTNPCRLELA